MFERYFSHDDTLWYLEELYQAYQATGYDSFEDRNKRDEYYGMTELLKNVVHDVIKMFPKVRKREYRPLNRAATHLSALAIFDQYSLSSLVVSSLLFVFQYERALHMQLAYTTKMVNLEPVMIRNYLKDPCEDASCGSAFQGGSLM
jgi:hypothetical protein